MSDKSTPNEPHSAPEPTPATNEDAQALLANFLTVDHPNRGKLFSDLTKQLKSD